MIHVFITVQCLIDVSKFLLDRESLAWAYFGKLFSLEDDCYKNEDEVYCSVCLRDLQKREESKELPTAGLVFFMNFPLITTCYNVFHSEKVVLI